MATTVKPIGGARLAPRFIIAEVEFDASGDATVTAKSLGLKNIQGFTGNVWGGSADHNATVHSTTSYVSGGVSSVVLEAKESDPQDASAPAALNVTIPVLFWGE